MEIKCSEHRKVVVLFSADQTTTEIKSSIQGNIIEEKYGGEPPEQKESGNNQGRKHRKHWRTDLRKRTKEGDSTNDLKIHKENTQRATR